MTLADAIRKGAMQRDQGLESFFGNVYEVRAERRQHMGKASCVLGAAYEGTFGAPDFQAWNRDSERDAYTELREAYPLLDRRSGCPLKCGSAFGLKTLMDALWHLNDQHEWTRERIADWLDTLPESTPSGGGRATTPGLGASG